MTTSTDKFIIDIQDKETVSVELAEKEIITVEILTVDTLTGLRKNIREFDDVNITNPENGQLLVYEDGKWINKTHKEFIDDLTVKNEVPTPLPPVLATVDYTTANAFISNSLEVFLNGIKLHTSDINITSTTTFKIAIDTIITDIVSVNYIKQ